MKKILHIDASGRHTESASRQLSAQIVKKFSSDDAQVTYRDVSQGLPFLDDVMIGSYFTPEEDRNEQQKLAIVKSDQIVQELLENDAIVIGVPIYNFAMPASLKAWADLAARAKVTFKYTENGPVGLLENKKAYVVVTSGGVAIDSPADFLSPWIRQFLGFLGISDVTIIDASSINMKGDAAIEGAKTQIQQLIA